MKHSPHIVQAGLQNIDPVDELRVNMLDRGQHRGCIGGWQGCQGNSFFDAEDARLAGAFRTAGIDKSLRFRQEVICRTLFPVQHRFKFDSTTGAPRVQDDNLSIL